MCRRGRRQERSQARDGDSLRAMPITSHDSRGACERIQDRFFRGLHGGRDDGIEMGVRQLVEGKGQFSRVVRNDIAGGERQHEIPAPVASGRPGTGKPQGGAFAETGQLPTAQRGVRGNDDDDGSFGITAGSFAQREKVLWFRMRQQAR